MPPPVQRDNSNLIAVGSTLLHLNNQLGLFHYNKLVYLFEYFYIKNFGKRFTKEVFVKLPHGPVIVEYKKHIENLVKDRIAECDLSLLREKRQVDDFIYQKVLIGTSQNTADHIFSDDILLKFTRNLSARFATLGVTDLERFVYSTQPMKKFVQSPWKRGGSYVLNADCIKMGDYSNILTDGRRKALEHLQRYPEIDYAQQERFAKEFSDLTALRPTV